MSRVRLKQFRSKKKLNSKEPYALLKSLIALLLVAICLVAANWQYHRGIDRQSRNSQIEANIGKGEISLSDISDPSKIQENEWRTVRIFGNFDREHEVLLRNHYNADGKYGFEYLTLFKSGNQKFWIDRGWVKAGETALARPVLPPTPTSEVEIVGRLRIDSALPKGSFFAIPATGNLINSWNLKSKVQTEDFYIDLISGPGVTPKSPAELPELSDGPHLAYALQWLFFAGLIIYGRYLIRKR